MNETEVMHFESVYPAETREREVGEVINYIKKGYSCQVVGLPGVGQSTFLKLLSYNKSVKLLHLGDDIKKYHFVLINFLEVRKKPLAEVFKFILISLTDSLRERGFTKEYEETLKIFKELTNFGDELVLFQGLKQALDLLILDKDISVVFLMDRFEEYIPNLIVDFFTNLRILRNRGKERFSVVFSLNRSLEESVEPALTSDFSEYITGNMVYLSLRENVILDTRLKKLEEISGKSLDLQIRERMIFLTGGFGRLAKNSAQLLLSSDYKASNANDLSKFLLSDPTIRMPIMDIWQTLNPSEQDFLLSNTDYSSSDADYPYLSNVGMLKDGKITIPLLEKYMRESIRAIEKKEENDPIRFNQDTNEIKKGTDVISDRLTHSEFKLLRFLIDKQNSIVDRESIINSVWSDTASIAGVTDQALDQLLLRLRRKIEDDPYNPRHIQTVKGRGIKFTP